MIEPTAADIERPVVYRPHPSAAPEHGTITSYNERGVFVAYTSGPFAGGRPVITPHHRLTYGGPRVQREAQP